MHRKLMELHLFTRTHVLILHGPSALVVGTFSKTPHIELRIQQVR